MSRLSQSLTRIPLPQDVAESANVTNLSDDVAVALAGDVEYRIHQVVEEAIKFMRHGKRTKLKTDDIDHALKTLNIEVSTHAV